MSRSRWRWGAGLALGVLLFLAAGALPVRSAPRYGSDYRLFASELESGGAFKFAEDTEDQLRSGKFELAFARYLFLKAHIRGRSLYTALNAMVDQRLHFLRSQMRLEEIPSYAAPVKKLRTRVRKQTPSVTPPGPAQKEGKTPARPVITPATAKAGEQKPPPPKPGIEEKPEEPAPPAVPRAAPPAAQAPAQPPEEEVQEEKAEAKKPPPPPSLWEKLKRRLKFW